MRQLMLGIWLCVGLSIAQGAFAESPAREIVVTGQGTVSVAPDMAIVTVGVTAQAASAQDAMGDVSEDVRAIFRAVIDLGIAPRDVQTTTLRLDPVFADLDGGGGSGPQGAPEIRGFIATNDVELRVRDMVQLGAILQAVLDQGANRISAIRFTVADPAPRAAEARRAAVADALARATLYADAAGVALGPVISIVEQGGARPPMRMASARLDMEAGMPIAAGELDISAQVTITYGIAD